MPATTESSKSSKREYPAILKLYTYCPLLNDKGCSIRRNDKKRNAKEKRQEEKCDVNPFRYKRQEEKRQEEKRQEEKRQEEKRQEEKRDANYRCLVSGGAPGIGKTRFGRDFFFIMSENGMRLILNTSAWILEPVSDLMKQTII
ncbi:unnamed protein product [Rhizophagus irregularis]|nr:unnamed protein product [Rhizophagus irregularis]